MSPTKTSFPAVRACIFDLDGLLINSEDILTCCINKLLGKYARPAITRAVRVQLMGVPKSTSSDAFHDWAQLPVAREQFARELSEEMEQQFTDCEPMAGAKKLLATLSGRSSSDGQSVELALATNTKTDTYRLKSSKSETKDLLSIFAADRRILGDDPRVERGKPAPDIYMAALDSLTKGRGSGGEVIRPDQCLVFEDSIAGVAAGRRAGMRVVWVPHPDVAAERQAGQRDVSTGETQDEGWLLGDMADGWVEDIPSLDHFDYGKYGIRKPT